VFIDDYCIWIQSVTEQKVQLLAKQMETTLATISKTSTPGIKELGLQVIEQLAVECVQEHADEDWMPAEEKERPQELL